jgi:hypothetical protein
VSGIRLRFVAPTSRGRLRPRYDARAHILALASSVKRPWPYSINVDAMLICDVDAQRVLAHVDLHYDRARWPRDATVTWPGPAPAADVIFESDALEAQSFPLPVDVRSDPTDRIVSIRVGDCDPDELHALSDDCIAQARNDELVGFVVRLPG